MFEPISLCICVLQAEGETAVLVAGDPEKEHMRKVSEDGGIYYHENVLKSMVSMFISLKIVIGL